MTAYVLDPNKFWNDSSISVGKAGPVTINGIPPVAVLISKSTASAGEAVAIAFKGRPNVRFFGQRTTGLTTANDVFAISDGSGLFLAVMNYADRDGNRYPDGFAQMNL